MLKTIFSHQPSISSPEINLFQRSNTAYEGTVRKYGAGTTIHGQLPTQFPGAPTSKKEEINDPGPIIEFPLDNYSTGFNPNQSILDPSFITESQRDPGTRIDEQMVMAGIFRHWGHLAQQWWREFRHNNSEPVPAHDPIVSIIPQEVPAPNPISSEGQQAPEQIGTSHSPSTTPYRESTAIALNVDLSSALITEFLVLTRARPNRDEFQKIIEFIKRAPVEIQGELATIMERKLSHWDRYYNRYYIYHPESFIEIASSSPPAYLRLIKGLDLTQLQIDDAGASVLANLPHLAGLEVLNLTENQIGDAGAAALANASHLLAGLKVLNLWKNQVGDPGAMALANSPHLAGLEELYLDPISEAGAAALKNSPHLAGLKVFNLTNRGWVKARLRLE